VSISLCQPRALLTNITFLENVLVDYWLAITHYDYEPDRDGHSVAVHLAARRALGRDIVRENLAQSATQCS